MVWLCFKTQVLICIKINICNQLKAWKNRLEFCTINYVPPVRNTNEHFQAIEAIVKVQQEQKKRGHKPKSQTQPTQRREATISSKCFRGRYSYCGFCSST
jgi:hypothetical protein